MVKMVKEERREQVLQSAKAVFSEKGYHAASVADIIDRAGIARGTFYLYFDSKRQIFDQILEDLLEDVDHQITLIDLGPGAPSPMEQLRENLRRVLTPFLEDPPLVQILLYHAVGLDPECQERLDLFYRKALDRIEASLRLGMAMGLVRPCNPRIAAACILGAIKESMAQVVERPEAGIGLEEIVDQIMQFGLRGVLEPPVSTSN